MQAVALNRRAPRNDPLNPLATPLQIWTAPQRPALRAPGSPIRFPTRSSPPPRPGRSFAFFHGNLSWNAGRNRLLRLAAACPPGPRAPLYYILLDCDAALRHVAAGPALRAVPEPAGGGGAPDAGPWRDFEGYLQRFEPAVRPARRPLRGPVR